MVLLFVDVKSDVGNAFQDGLAHGLLDFEMVGSRKWEEQVLVEWYDQVAHTTATLANPFAFGCSEGTFDGVVGEVAIRHSGMEEDKEVAISVIFKMPQPDAERIRTDGVVDVDIESHTVFLPPLGFRDDGALVERVVVARSQYQCQANS